MGIEDAKRRLAAHAEDESADAPIVEETGDVAETGDDPEPLTVKQLLRFTRGTCEPTIIGLKRLGVLKDEGDALVYTLVEPPKPSAHVPPGMTKLRLTKVVKGRHRRQMLAHGETNNEGVLIPIRHVLYSWVSALSEKPMNLLDELAMVDCDALMSVAQYIEDLAGNE